MLDRALKTLGLEEIEVVLHPEVSASVVVNIAHSQDEAEQQAHLGRAVDVDELDQNDDDDGAISTRCWPPSTVMAPLMRPRRRGRSRGKRRR